MRVAVEKFGLQVHLTDPYLLDVAHSTSVFVFCVALDATPCGVPRDAEDPQGLLLDELVRRGSVPRSGRSVVHELGLDGVPRPGIDAEVNEPLGELGWQPIA